jgi:hypothetical protein
VRGFDRIDPGRMMAARFAWGEQTVAQEFNYPPAFQTLSAGAGRDWSERRDDHRDGQQARDQRDNQPPRISDLTPSNGARLGERGRTSIRARFDDIGSGIDLRSVRVKVDGLDVTDEARITTDDMAYVERLGRGRHTAELVVRDRAGNAARTSWSFNVV